MTTAARPTFNPAKGGQTARDRNVPTQSYSSRELPSHTFLKLRKEGQDTPGELSRKDFKAELLLREKEHFDRAREQLKRKRLELLQSGVDCDDDDDEGSDLEGAPLKKSRLKRPPSDTGGGESPVAVKRELDAGHPNDDDDASSDPRSSSSGSDSETDDEEEDDAALMRELQKIKAERAAAAAAAQKKAQAESDDAIMSGNSLLNLTESPSFTVSRRWDDDVIFKNQSSRRDLESGGKRRFINDLLRSDFHRKFMAKYIQ